MIALLSIYTSASWEGMRLDWVMLGWVMLDWVILDYGPPGLEQIKTGQFM